MQIETADDRREFFNTADFAVECLINGPAGFSATIPVNRDATTDPVGLYETNVEAPHESFTCRVEELAGVDRKLVKQYTATIGPTTYRIERIANDQDGLIATVELKK
jgi:hypothetical protein